MLKNKEPIASILAKLEKLAKRINVLVRKMNVMGLQLQEQKEYYKIVGEYSSMKLTLADRVFDKEILPTLQTEESTKLSMILRSQINWDTSLLITPDEVDTVSNAYLNHDDKHFIFETLNKYFIILTDNLINLFDEVEEENDTDTEESILNMGKLLTTYDEDISLFKAKKLIHDHLLYKFETIYMIFGDDDK